MLSLYWDFGESTKHSTYQMDQYVAERSICETILDKRQQCDQTLGQSPTISLFAAALSFKGTLTQIAYAVWKVFNMLHN